MNIEDLTFPVSLEWGRGRRVRLHADGKHTIDVATPPPFPGGIDGVWSPEEMLVGAAASCYAVTLLAVAEHRRVPITDISIVGDVRLSSHDSGRVALDQLSLHVRVDTEEGYSGEVERAAEKAKRSCFVTGALEIPLRLELDVRTPTAA